MTALSVVPVMNLLGQWVGLTILAGVAAGGVAAAFRWYFRRLIPGDLASLVGLSSVALYLNTTATLGSVIGGGSELVTLNTALFHLGLFLSAGVVAAVGSRAGDRVAVGVRGLAGVQDLEEEFGAVVRAVGRATPVTLPDEVEDLEGYDPVERETKEKLAGRTLLFPRNLMVNDLESRLVNRLKADFGVGVVDVDLRPDGSVSFLGVGRRMSGLGPSLAPGTVAVVVWADPAFGTGPGDAVQVWGGEPPERVLTGEVRGVTDDFVTLAVDGKAARRLEPSMRYRLVTLPVDGLQDREFVSLLSSAEEAMGVVRVSPGGPLDGVPVGEVAGAVVAVDTGEGVEAVPSRSRVLRPGDTVYVLAVPEVLRRMERGEGDAHDKT